MCSVRGLLILVLAVVADHAWAQSSTNPVPKTPPEMADEIARTIQAKALQAPSGSMAFESATSHDNIVEVRYAAKDARFFPQSKADGDNRRLGIARYLCFNHQISLFQKSGIAIHEVLAAPNHSAPFEVTIDQSTCATLFTDTMDFAQIAAQKRAAQPTTGPNSLTEPRRVHTMAIPPDQGAVKPPQSPTGPSP